MFVLASLMALAAAGAALDLTGSREPDDDDDLPPTLGPADTGEAGDVSSATPETGLPEFLLPSGPSAVDTPIDLVASPIDASEPVEPITTLEPITPIDPFVPLDPYETFEPLDPFTPYEPGEGPAQGGTGVDPFVGGGFEIAPVWPVDDLIEGGADGNDLFGGTGNDTIHAGAGNDWVQGDGTYDAAGADEIRGGEGGDSLAGQGGDDIIWGDEGDDTVYGGEGQDTLFGGAGNDWLSGNDGDDLLVSGGGADDLDGGRGNDHLVGDDDPDTVWMHGGEGDDTLAPGAGDFVEGQDGADQFVLQQAPGQLPVIADFDAQEDQMVLHLPDSIAQGAQVGLNEDEDGTVLITVNGEAIGRMLQTGGLLAQDIVVVRLPG